MLPAMRWLIVVVVLWATAAHAETCSTYRITSAHERRVLYRLVRLCPACNPTPQFAIVEPGMTGTAQALARENGTIYFTDVKWDAALLMAICSPAVHSCHGAFVFDVPVEAKVARSETATAPCAP
jgi:hypothetical protein